MLEDWTAVTAEEIQKLISSAPNKMWELDWWRTCGDFCLPSSRCCSANHWLLLKKVGLPLKLSIMSCCCCDLSINLVCVAHLWRGSVHICPVGHTESCSQPYCVHAFVTSRVDYCNLLLAGAPKYVTDKLQQIMNAAAQVVSSTKKYDDGLTHLLHSELHWLNVTDRVTYKLGVMVYKCLHGHWPGTGLSVWPVHTGHSSCWTTASSFCQLPSTLCSTVSAWYVRPSYLRCRWTDMELVPKQFAWAGHVNGLFSSYTEDVSFWSVLGTPSAQEAFFATMRYINGHLHYIFVTLSKWLVHVAFLHSYRHHWWWLVH